MLEAPPLLSPVDEASDFAPPGRRNFWVAFAVVAILGVLLRIVPSAGFKGIGFDESLYRSYVQMLDARGLSNYADLTEIYLADQQKPDTITKLPPTRFLYIFSGWLWKRAEFGGAPPLDLRQRGNIDRDPALVSLHRISCLFSILFMLAAGAAAWRMFDPKVGLGVLALVAFAPVQIHMGQHALIDGFFAFWATLCVWALWENLRQPDHPGWLTLYGVSLALMVMTKENSFFVFCALCGAVIANRWAKWGTVTPKLLLITVAGPLAGVAALVTLAGGLLNFIETYRLLVEKAQNLEYAIKTGDGPWYRYLVDLLLVSPIVLCLAIGGVFQLPKQRSSYLYLLAFVVFSYVLMCNVRYSMNLRYTTIWDLPLRAFAFGQLALLSQHFGRRQPLALLVAVAALCAYELRQYVIFFSDGALYELVTEGLLRSVQILK
ncbi:phospholipid carrier-dependent glycosyltransferase [Verrucomicrobiota bacterium sgz303538]